MKGYRTIVLMACGLGYSVLAHFGIVVPESDQAAISTAIVSVVGIVMRFRTDTPVGGN